jgi:diaminohydroxyphosphoribosylaminopyrimidine deaminase/5-amino-6-(5-phosphoribosylamino)uracil reductase
VNETEAMQRALQLAATEGVPLGPNPRVGCVLLRDGEVLAQGYHRGAGTPHAEADALSRCTDATGSTAVVTLEPCNHTGRTGPCAQALIAAGVSRVVYALPDPNPVAAGGAQTLRDAGVQVSSGLLEDHARDVNQAWLFGLSHQRPLVTWKFAASLDGRSAAADGTSQWITGPEARADVHRLRAQCDVILVGTGTVATDDPLLTVRTGTAHQPLRAVMGMRELSPELKVFNHDAETVVLRTHDPEQALVELFEAGRRHVWLEGGPTLAAVFLRTGFVDEVIAYIAPALLGAGRSAVGDFGVSTIAETLRLDLHDVTRIGGDVRLRMSPRRVTQRPAD